MQIKDYDFCSQTILFCTGLILIRSRPNIILKISFHSRYIMVILVNDVHC